MLDPLVALRELQILVNQKDIRIAELEKEIERLRNPRVHDVTDIYDAEESATGPQMGEPQGAK